MKRVTSPHPFWLAHSHWVRERQAEGRGRWEPAALNDLEPQLEPQLAEEVAAEITAIAEAYGADRGPGFGARSAE